MKKSKDPFEVAFEEQDESPPESPVDIEETGAETTAGPTDANPNVRSSDPSTSVGLPIRRTAGQHSKPKEEEEEEEEENMSVEIGKLSSTPDPAKSAKWQEVLNQFTGEQMSRYESFRRSAFQKSSVKRLLTSITGSAKVSLPMTIVVSGVAKMFVGELIEAAKMVMAERKDSGPIRPCHIREAYRRLKLDGKIPKRSVPRLFH